MNTIESRYTSGQYLTSNPSWDIEDSPWKAGKVFEILESAGLQPSSICDVGCGAGGVLAALRPFYPRAELFGFDIASDAAGFWKELQSKNIHFQVGDFFEEGRQGYDVVMLLDVIEHLENPFEFLDRIRAKGNYFVFHVPLDLSAISVIRERPLLYGREKVGHIHYYTKELALALIRETGYSVLECRYTGAWSTGPQRRWRTRLAGIPRRLANFINKDLGVRCLGGETLMILARPAD